MLCKYCKKNEALKYSKYSSGEFCSKGCSNGYSTSAKRSEINRKVSKSLSGRHKPTPGTKIIELEGKTYKVYEKFCPTCEKMFLIKNSYAKYCSKKCVIESNEYRMKISQKRTEYLQKNKNVKWYSVENITGEIIKVQGQWELKLANRLNDIGILFSRHSIKFKESHSYTPDFYLPEHDIYIEVKGFLYEKDKYKMLKVIEEKKVHIKYIDSLKLIELLDKESLFDLPNVLDLFKMDDIDFTKFVLRY